LNVSDIGSSGSAAQREPASQVSGLGQQDFLKMLLAQLEHQDPLDPQDATEFTAQLAQFSSLDQLVSMRQAVDSLSSSGGISNGLAAAGLIGNEALGESAELSIPAGGADRPGLLLELPNASEILSVALVDSSGQTVAQAAGLGTLTAGLHELTWEDFNAAPAPGRYRVRTTVANGDPEPVTLVTGRVSGAALDPSGTTLMLGGLQVPLSAVREIGTGPNRER